MKRLITPCSLLGYALALGLLNYTPALAGPALVVDDDLVECPGAGFATIQDAVDAAGAGTKIRVCPGTYDEQVSISKNVEIGGDSGAVVKPSGMVANTTSLATGNPIAAAILVRDTANAVIKSLTVDGVNNGIAGCAPTLVGIFYRNASGKVEDVAVMDMRLGAGLEGCQSGQGIYVQSGGGLSSKVEIRNNSVHDFQKNGITGNEVGTDIRVERNVVTGIGPTDAAAQNGIQIGWGAIGWIEENTVINHIWSPCVSVSVCDWVATNILIYDSNNARIDRNVVGKGQVGIYLQGNNGRVGGNNVFDTDVFDGIVLYGDNNRAEGNRITNSDEAAVWLDGDNNKVTGNWINEAPIGVWKFGGGGNVVAGNHFVNTPTPFLDPPSSDPGANPIPFR